MDGGLSLRVFRAPHNNLPTRCSGSCAPVDSRSCPSIQRLTGSKAYSATRMCCRFLVRSTVSSSLRIRAPRLRSSVKLMPGAFGGFGFIVPLARAASRTRPCNCVRILELIQSLVGALSCTANLSTSAIAAFGGGLVCAIGFQRESKRPIAFMRCYKSPRPVNADVRLLIHE